MAGYELMYAYVYIQDLANKPAPPVPGSKEFARLQELEDLVAHAG